MLETTSSRDPLGDPGDSDTGVNEKVRDIVGRGLAFDIRGERQNNFRDALVPYAHDELRQLKIFRRNIIQRGKPAPENVVATGKRTGALNGEDIGRLFDDAK